MSYQAAEYATTRQKFLGNPEANAKVEEDSGPTIKEAICGMLDTPHGQQFQMWLRHECHFVRATTVVGDPVQSNINEGKRQVYLAILAYQQLDDAQLINRAIRRAR